jgi:hypothetical protein
VAATWKPPQKLVEAFERAVAQFSNAERQQCLVVPASL